MNYYERFNKYIQKLKYNQNLFCLDETKDLVTYDEYKSLLLPVINVIERYPGKSLEEYRDILYNESGIANRIRDFIINKHMAPGLALSYGTKTYEENIVIGYQQEIDFADDKIVEKPEKMKVDSLFDLASITKVFTCTIVLSLISEGKLQFDNKIYDLDNRFINLKNVSVEDLLSFRIPLITKQRIDTAETVEDAYNYLWNIEVDTLPQIRLYSDMGALVLGIVLERVEGKSLFKLAQDKIFNKFKMNDTGIIIHDDELARVVSNNFEYRIVNSEDIIISDVNKGIINDSKARMFNTKEKSMYGHAGLFSTICDMSLFAQKYIRGEIIPIEFCQEVGKNRTGKHIEGDVYVQYLGYLCYSKHPKSYYSEVLHCLSGNAFGLGGYTGNQLTIDVNNEIFCFMASNRCHNRVTSIIPTSDESNYIYENSVPQFVTLTNGRKYIYTKKFAFERDTYVRDIAINLALQYRCLEYVMNKPLKGKSIKYL